MDIPELEQYGVRGVNALAEATPMDTGVTAASWDYEIIRTDNTARLIWTNSNIVNGVNIAAILQYGHATGNGGYVEAIDYINPALRDLFNEAIDKYWDNVVKDSVEKFDRFLDTFADTAADKLSNFAFTFSMLNMIPVLSNIPALKNFGQAAKFTTINTNPNLDFAKSAKRLDIGNEAWTANTHGSNTRHIRAVAKWNKRKLKQLLRK